MSRICPNCNYSRKPSDSAPEWQCPSCEIAYNKGAGADVGQSYGRHYSPPVARSSSGLAKWIVILAIAGAGAWFGKPLWQTSASESSTKTRHREQPAVTLYATSWCGYCAATRQFFAEYGIQYTERDIEQSSAAAEEHRRLGGNGVPLIVIGDELVNGYNEAELRSQLKPWLKRS